MNVELIENRWKALLTKELETEMKKAPMVSQSHDLSHVCRVWNNAKLIATDLNVDWEILIAGIYLHDIGRHYPEGVEIHGPISAIYAEKILKKISFPNNKIIPTLEAIKYHDEAFSSDKRPTLEAKVLYDADKIDAFGPVGISRYLIFFSARGKSQKEIIEYALANLPIRFQGLELDESRRKGKDKYDYAIDYFKKLDNESV